MGTSCFLKFSMINLNLKYNNDDKKECKNQLEINRIGNKNCWITKMDISTGAWLIMSQPNALLILGDHLFLNYIFFLGRGAWLIPRVLLILTWHYIPLSETVHPHHHHFPWCPWPHAPLRWNIRSLPRRVQGPCDGRNKDWVLKRKRTVLEKWIDQGWNYECMEVTWMYTKIGRQTDR